MVVDSLVNFCSLNLSTFTTIVDLCILTLGLYDIVSGMDWLGTLQANIDFHRKMVPCVDDIGRNVELLGVQRLVSLCMISANQLKQSVQKGC